jgi:hypothetical protein
MKISPVNNYRNFFHLSNSVNTQRFNHRQELDGPLFHGRHKAIVIAEAGHLMQLVRNEHHTAVIGPCDSIDLLAK